ncbi:unnamed protein product, partial [Staurois parvus]
RYPAVAPASSAHLCPAARPLAPPSSATHLCPAVPPTCAHPPVQPSSAASQCHQSSVPSSVTYQCRLSVLHISAAYPCHLISTAYQCPLVLPISAASSTHISEGEKLPV